MRAKGSIHRKVATKAIRMLFRVPAIAQVVGTLLFSLATTGVAVAQAPVPLINQPLLPDAIHPGGPGFTLTVNGTGFVSASAVNWNGNPLPTTFVSGSQLTAIVPASDVTSFGTASVTVVSPGSHSNISNVAFLEMTYPGSTLALSGASNFGNGSITLFVTTADFNNDGKMDVALLDNEVMVLLGNGDGTFQPAVQYAAGSGPSSLAVGDLNGDGKLDLAVANASGNNVSVLLGRGDGTFLPAVNYPVGAGPQSVAVGDFNRDGQLDLAVANLGSATVSVLPGNGDGTFKPAFDYALDTGPQSVAVADLNGDGNLDLALALGNFDGTGAEASVLMGNGDGTFQSPVSYATGRGPFSIILADLNGDGKLDLVTANAYVSSVTVLLGNGDGTFNSRVDYPVGSFPVAVTAADMNGRATLDLIVANQDSSSVSVLLGNGDGTFQTRHDYPVAVVNQLDSPESVAVADFNGDGRLDIVVPTYGSGQAGVLLQVPTIAISTSTLTFGNPVVGMSASQPLTVSNISGPPVSIGSIAVTGTNATDFSQTNTCGSGLPPGGGCTITVTFAPTQVGPEAASLIITDNAARSPQAIALSGTGGVSGPNATLTSGSLTFATQPVGTASPVQSVTLSNYGTATLGIMSIGFTGADASDFRQTNTCGRSTAPGASCTINVTFNPTQIGPLTAALSILDSAPGSPQIVSLGGTGTIVKIPATLNYGSVRVGTTATTALTLTNVGKTTLSISSITINGNDNDEFFQSNTCGSAVEKGKSCTITVSFKPTELGLDSAVISINDNGGGSPQLVSLSGSGCVPLPHNTTPCN